MSSLFIRGGRVVSPEDGLDGVMDIRVEDGLIVAVGSPGSPQVGETLDARGEIVSPGFIDLHVHLREPGGEESETIATGLAAAVAGGFTAVCPMPNTQPVNDNPEITRWLREKAEQAELARVFPIAAASVGSKGERLTDFTGLAAAGAVAFSDDGRPLKTRELMQRALEHASPLGLPVIDHCENLSFSAGGVINAGGVAERLGVKGIPDVSELECVMRDLELAAATGAPLHLAHLSTAGSVERVRAAKQNGVRVSCEVTPHHFTLTEEAVVERGTNAKMNPPLRTARNREAIINALADGTIDAIATDHAPHAERLKLQPLAMAPFGVIGLETALALGLTQLVEPGRISLLRLIELLSSRPARILGKPLGRLRPGSAADVTIFDPHPEWTYRASEGKSKSRNSPFDGWKLKGIVTATIVGGTIVYRRPK
ncbi:MAG: dihydroorotase [Terriglobia bacterium]